MGRDIEQRYAALFTNQKGNVAKPLRLGLGACIIQAEYGYSDVEVTLQIQECAYLQYFCGYKAYDDSKPPFDPSLMVYFRKRLTPEILGEINEMILAAQNSDDEASDDSSSNGGTMIVDATCAPSQIKYPQDTALLNEARENTEALIDVLHTPGAKKPRTYRKRAHKDYLALVRTRTPGQKTELHGRMRTYRSGAAILIGKAVLRSWPHYGKTKRNRLPLHCHVHSCTEFKKNSARALGALALVDGVALCNGKVGVSSVDII